MIKVKVSAHLLLTNFEEKVVANVTKKELPAKFCLKPKLLNDKL